MNTDLVTVASYLDSDLGEGTYIYTVKAVDTAGINSESSNSVSATIDITGPEVKIRAPQDGGQVSGLIDIKGTAYSSSDFKQYQVSIGEGLKPFVLECYPDISSFFIVRGAGAVGYDKRIRRYLLHQT